MAHGFGGLEHFFGVLQRVAKPGEAGATLRPRSTHTAPAVFCSSSEHGIHTDQVY